MKIVAGIVFGFVLGFLGHFSLSGGAANKDHWKNIEKYNAFVNAPSNYKPDPTTGAAAATPPIDPMPSLAALEAAGELRHMDLVFPKISYTREAIQASMKYCHNHKEIVYATGNRTYDGVQITGVHPLHLNLWFREGDIVVVQNLIKELEGKYAK
jgi:hypothetical protein